MNGLRVIFLINVLVMVDVQNVSMAYPIEKSYKETFLNPFAKRKTFTALNRISIKIETGDKVAFLGGNGAGKTTLLKLIGGLLYPTTGSVLIDGFDIVQKNQQARDQVGFVLNEERSFYWRLTGRQNLSFFGALDNYQGKDLDSKVSHLLELVKLGKAADRVFAGYSSGMKQRLALARGLIGEPKILILDEPTRALDPITTKEMQELVQSIYSHNQKTLLIATHNLDEAVMLCNKLCVMKDGHIVYFATVSEAINEYGDLYNCYKKLVNEKQTL